MGRFIFLEGTSANAGPKGKRQPWEPFATDLATDLAAGQNQRYQFGVGGFTTHVSPF